MQIQFSHILLVGIGGMVGSILRFVTSSWFVQNIPPTWPWGTFFVNIAGCLIIGIVLGAPWKQHTSEMWRLLLASGFCGGFTTFSAFSSEGYQMLKNEMFFLFAAYAACSIVLGLLAVSAGYFLIRTII